MRAKFEAFATFRLTIGFLPKFGVLAAAYTKSIASFEDIDRLHFMTRHIGWGPRRSDGFVIVG